MKLLKGNMWSVYNESDLFCITCNSELNSKGELIMGKGIAKQAKEMFPLDDLSFMLAYEIKHTCGPLGIYGLIIPHYRVWRTHHIGAFQTKTYWRQPARLDIILRSTAALLEWIESHPEVKRVDLNFPGIGEGKLERSAVLPLIEVLPDTVHIWELP